MTASDQQTGHAFICYSHTDSAQVDQLEEKLRSAGIPVWRDTAKLWPGEDWKIRIRNEIRNNAIAFIVCFSEASTARSRSFQYEELTLAIELMRQRSPDDTWLIPVRFDECRIPDPDIGGGRTLASIHCADLFGDQADDIADRLTEIVRKVLSAGHDGPGPGAAGSFRAPAGAATSPRPPRAVAAALESQAAPPGETTGPDVRDNGRKPARAQPSAAPGEDSKPVRLALTTGRFITAVTAVIVALTTALAAIPPLRHAIASSFERNTPSSPARGHATQPGTPKGSPTPTLAPESCMKDPPRYFVSPQALPGSASYALTICPVDVNEGAPVGLSYSLSGEVIGTVPPGYYLAVVSRPDPDSCDSQGNPGNGYWYLQREIPASRTGASWSISEGAGYSGSESIRHVIYFVLATGAELHALAADSSSLPPGISELAFFSVQGHVPAGHTCPQ